MSKAAVEGHRKDKLKHIDPKTIIMGERFREDLGDITGLIEAIREKGLIQPISIDTNNCLLAGGRRLTAVLSLELPTIPVIIREATDELDLREIELMENIHRKDFDWPEQARLTAAIHKLFVEKYPDWSLRRTAEVVDTGKSQVHRELHLAAYLEAVPELANCKTADEAGKMIKKMEEQAIVQELAKRQQERIADVNSQAPGLDRGIANALKVANDSYVIGDVFKGMSGLRSNGHISIIECDPPYGIELNEQKAGRDSVTSTVTGYKEVHGSEYEGFLSKLTKELYRVAGKDCWLVFWYGQSWHNEVLTALREAGWEVDEIPAVWIKPNGQTLQPELYYARCWEPFFLCRKGKPVMAERGRSNVFQFGGAKDKYHPTQRPVELIEEILERHTTGMDTVFVPFLGSGATLRAAFNRGLKAFGFDLDGKYKDKFMLAVEEDAKKLFST
jgi:ParB/RepB/Spo0J family partition protein